MRGQSGPGGAAAGPRGWAARYVALCQRRGAALLLLGIVAAALAALPLGALGIDTDMASLLPDSHPAVVALRRMEARRCSASSLILLVSSPDREANRRFARALAPGLERLRPAVFSEIQWRPSGEIADYAERWRWLYAELPDLQRAEALLDRVVLRRESPLYVDLEDDPEEELRALERRLAARLPARRDGPFFEAQDGDGQHLGILLWRRGEGVGGGGARQALRAVQGAVAAAGPGAFHPALRVAYTGHIAQALEEQDGIREDLTVATALCAALIGLVIFLHFRRVALLALIAAPALLGVELALSLASLTIHKLNLNTAFLISIILGNGINAPILLLGRCAEERLRGAPLPEALGAALQHTLRATATAAGAAAIAYGCLALTQFRGFNQFALVGGVGMLVTWALTFLLLPPSLLVVARRWPGALRPLPSRWQGPFLRLGRLCGARPRALAAAAAVLLASLLPATAAFLRDPLEWNFDRLRSDETSAGRLWARAEAMGIGDPSSGYVGAHAMMLVDREDQADEIAAALLAQDRRRGADHVLSRVRTLRSLLPENQAEKLALLSRVRGTLDRLRPRLDAERWRRLAPWRPPDGLRPLRVDDLPAALQTAFTEADGTQGRLLLIDVDRSSYSDWDGRALLRLSTSLRVEAQGRSWVAASYATVFAGMLEAIRRDGPPLVLAAGGAVVVLLLLSLGAAGAGAVVLTVAVGLCWTAGLAGLLHLKLNFVNFVAVPITLGVGADYATNLRSRIADARGDGAAGIGATAAVVALCSATTVIGYSSLLLSRNQALRSFGLLADLGELTCLLAALLLLPALCSPRR